MRDRRKRLFYREIRSCNGGIKKTWSGLQKAGQKAGRADVFPKEKLDYRRYCLDYPSKFLKNRRKGITIASHLSGVVKDIFRSLQLRDFSKAGCQSRAS